MNHLVLKPVVCLTLRPAATNGRLNQAWYDSTNLVLMTSVAGAVLLVLILSITVFLVRRAKQVKSTKGPM